MSHDKLRKKNEIFYLRETPSMRSKARKAVALLIETSNAYARGLLEGIVEYQRERDSWSIFLPEQERGAAPPSWLNNWVGDGILARIETAAIARSVSRLRLPVVDLSSSRVVPDIPWVETDDLAIATLAFQHFYEKGFRNFAFCGPRGFNWARWRREHFVALCERAKVDIQVLETESPYRKTNLRSKDDDAISKWLSKLNKPVGILCAYDIQAQVILDTCRNLQFSVPEEVSVVGVDNDTILCELCHPSLTSVMPDARGAGYQAAKLLDNLMSKRSRIATATARPVKSILLKPLGMIQRQSSDITSVSDPNISAAIRFIRDHACDGINVIDVLSHVPLSRRALEAHFFKATGKTPHDMILSVRLARVHQLLKESDLSLDEIAKHSGFEHTEYMSVVFKKHYDLPPGRYRRS
jgi:LacI family transcriptional regulator